MRLETSTRILAGALMVSLLTISGAEVKAAITYGGPTAGSGLGFGNKYELLTLQGPNKGSQYGGVFWDGLSDNYSNVSNVDAGKSQTYTFGQLHELGYNSSNFLLFLDLNQGGKDIVVKDFTLDFYDGSGVSQFNLSYNSNGGVTRADNGGGSSNWDHYYSVTFDDSNQAADFDDLANSNWRIGMNITSTNAMTQSLSGKDTFGLSQVPEPSTIVIWSILSGIGLLVGWRQYAQRAF